MQFSRIYNKKPFNSQHDIAVSLVFSIFNPVSACTGGISVAFYEDSLISPFGGGINGSLGYSPYVSSTTPLTAFDGLQNAFVGIGLDVSGEFSKKSEGKTTGYFKNNPNSIVFRGSQNDGYNLLSFSENLYNLYGIQLGQNNTSETQATDLKIRILMTEQGRKIKVQRVDGPDSFLTLAEQTLNGPGEVAFRVACAFVSADDTTRCKIKEFNVYGFSDEFAENYDSQLDYDLAACLQKIQRAALSISDSKKVFLGKNNLFVENSSNKSFSNYIKTINYSSPFYLRQTVSYPLSSVHYFMDSDNENIFVAKESSSKNLRLYRNMGRNVVPEYTVYSTGVSGFAESVSIDKNLLFVSTVSSINVYERSGYNWNYLNSIQTLSGRPYNIKFKNDNGIVACYDGSVQIFENNGSNVYTNVYYNSGLGTLDEGFGTSLDISKNYAVIGVPYKDNVFTDDGSVFVFTKTTSWSATQILTQGENPYAYFGNSVSLFNDLLAVGVPGNTVSLNANAGLIKIYDLLQNGYASLRNTYPPINLGVNLYLGQEVDVKNSVLVARAYNNISVYSLCCAPAYIPPAVVPPCAIPLITNLTPGFIKKIDDSGYVITIQCPKPALTPLSAFCTLITILSSEPMYSINGYNVLSPIYCPITAVNVEF